MILNSLRKIEPFDSPGVVKEKINALIDALNEQHGIQVGAPLAMTGSAGGQTIFLNDIDYRLTPVRLTSVATVSSQNRYGFKEQMYDPTAGTYSDATVGITGDGTVVFATEVNNQLLTVPGSPPYQLEWVRFKGVVNGVAQYEFSAGQGSSGSLSVFQYPSTLVVANCTKLLSDSAGVLTFSEPSTGTAQFTFTDAALSTPGIVSATTQTFDGNKTIHGTFKVEGTSGSPSTMLFEADVDPAGPYQVASNPTNAQTLTLLWEAGFTIASNGVYGALILTNNSGTSGQTPAFAIRDNHAAANHIGQTGTGGGGDTVTGGLITTLGTPTCSGGISASAGGNLFGPYVSTPPAHSTSAGTAGEYAMDANFFYGCYSFGAWGRIAWTSTSF